MTGVGVITAQRRLVRTTEAHEVRRDDSPTPRDQARDHEPVQIGPAGLAVQQDNNLAVSWSLVQVGHAQVLATVGILDERVRRREGEVGKVVEPIVRCAKSVHVSQLSLEA